MNEWAHLDAIGQDVVVHAAEPPVDDFDQGAAINNNKNKRDSLNDKINNNSDSHG